MGLVHFLGVGPLTRTYPDNERVAAAIEDAVGSEQPGWLSTELAEFAVIDHGPAIRRKLLANFAEHAFPHWPAAALAAHWPDDAEIQPRSSTHWTRTPCEPRRSPRACRGCSGLRAPSTACWIYSTNARRSGIPHRLHRPRPDRRLHHARRDVRSHRRTRRTRLPASPDRPRGYVRACSRGNRGCTPFTNQGRHRARQADARARGPAVRALLAGYKHDLAMLPRSLTSCAGPRPGSRCPFACTCTPRCAPPHTQAYVVRELAQSWPLQRPRSCRSPPPLPPTITTCSEGGSAERSPAKIPARPQVIQREVAGDCVPPTARKTPGAAVSAWLGALLLEEPGLIPLRDPRGPATSTSAPWSANRIILLSQIADGWPQLQAAHFGRSTPASPAGRLLQRESGTSGSTSHKSQTKRRASHAKQTRQSPPHPNS